MNQGILLYCRAGFEKECAAEITHAAEALGVPGFVRAAADTAHVLFFPHEAGGLRVLRRSLRFVDLVFARQLIFDCRMIEGLPPADRLSGVMAAVAVDRAYSSIEVEPADTNEGKTLSSFCRKFSPYLERALSARGQFGRATAPRLHVFFVEASRAWVGESDAGNASDWPMGIVRLRMPGSAPSRSTLKLAEAWMVLMSEREREANLVGGMRAVDLGAAPGGWSWQLAHRGMLVTAVDNGRMDAALMAGGMVEHVRADGFAWRPRKTVDWMVCDIVDKPSRVAALAADWLIDKRARHVMVNFKLPMKQRFQTWLSLRDYLIDRAQAAGRSIDIRARQLYHDREEITAYLALR